jgi:hypothetical protein
MNNLPDNRNDYNLRYYDEDEISLIDIAKIIIKRWKWSLGIFLIFMITMFSYVYYAGAKLAPIDYVSIYRVAETSPGSPIISLKSTGEKTELYYIGLVVQNFIEQKKVENIPFKIDVNASEDSGLVVIKSSAAEADEQRIKQIKDAHKELVEIISKEESVFLNHKKEVLERNLKNSRKALDMLKTAQSLNAVELSAKYMDQIVQMENDLSGLRSGELLQLGYGNKPENRVVLISALGVMAAFFIALITPFFVEFGANLRQSLKEDK